MAVRDKELDQILDLVDDFGEDTYYGMEDTYYEDLKHKEQRWKFDWPMFNEAFPTLLFGRIDIIAPANVGKSALVLNMNRQILDNNNDVKCVMFVLDDDKQKAHRFMVASEARLHLTDVILPGRLDEQDKRIEDRKKAYSSLRKRYRGKLEVFDGSSFRGKGAHFDTIALYLKELRRSYPKDKIWVSVDAFDNVRPGSNWKESVGSKAQFISEGFKELAERLDIVIVNTKHQIKYNRGRGANADVGSGSGQLEYDAAVTIILHCEVAEMGQSAEIFFERDDKDDEKCPILEVQFVKNKGGEFKKKTIFMNQYPEQYYVEECDQEDQEFYREEIATMIGAKNNRKGKVDGGDGKA